MSRQEQGQRVRATLYEKIEDLAMNGSVPNIIVFAIYKTNEGDWRGFCVPYDVSCNAPTVKEAERLLEELVDLYKEGLKKYNYPKHLSIKALSNPEDKKVFDGILGEIANEIAEQTRKRIERQFKKYELDQTPKNTFRIKNVRGRYFEHAYA